MKSTTPRIVLLLVLPLLIPSAAVAAASSHGSAGDAAGDSVGDAAHRSSAAVAEVSIPDVDLLTLEPKMAKFLVKKVGVGSSREARLNGLTDAIFSKRGLGIRYGNTRTKTAAETFKDRSGNCLSFTFLFVAMARHLGLEAYFMEVSEALSWDQRGEIVVSNQHMFAEVEIDNGEVQVDFLPGAEKRYFAVRRISDAQALGHYYNNLGAEKLTAGDPQIAVQYFRKALESDPKMIQAMVNQGFAFRRLKDFAAAEASYLRALEIRSGNPSAASNLASLYLAQGRREEAEPYLRRAQGYQQRNPFHHYRLALQRAATGNYPAAIKHVKDAIRRDSVNPDFHATLGGFYAEEGDRERALDSFKKALRLTDDSASKADLERRRDALLGHGASS